MLCPFCQSECPEEAHFCAACGTEMAFSASPTVRRERSGVVPETRFAPGASFGERYTIVESIGAGGQARVFKAIDRQLGETVALKLISPELASNESSLIRFKRELSLGQKVSHINVCRVHDIGDVSGSHYISMEYIDGQNLHDWVQAVGKLSPYQTIKLGRQICAGLAAIHAKAIVHRDLKPRNIMLDRSGRSVVMDFGLAHHPEVDHLTAPGEALGTLAYFSPEQAKGAAVTPRTDIYAVGLMLFEMLTGRRPPGDDRRLPLALRDRSESCPPPSRFSPDVPAALDGVVLRCLERAPEERYPSVDDVGKALAEAAETLSAVSQPSGGAAPPRKTRHKTAVGAALVGVLIVLAIILAVLWPSGEPAPEPIQLALLPLEYQGPDGNTYLRNLVPVVLGRELGRSPHLSLVSFDSSRSFAAEEEPGSVARQLAVDQVVHGKIEVRDRIFSATLQIFDAEMGADGWSMDIEGELSSIVDAVNGVADEMLPALGIGRAYSSSSPDAGPSSQAMAYYLDGRTYLEGWDVEQNHQRASEAFSNAIRSDDDFAEAYAGLARSFWKGYEATREPALVEQALSAARRAVSLDGFLPEAQLALGEVQLGRGRSAEAVKSFGRARELAPADDGICRRVADAYAAMGREADAERMYDLAIDLRPSYWENYNYKGAFYLELGRLDQAADLFQQVISLRPQSDIGYANLAVVHILAGDLLEAEPLLHAALEINPSSDVHNNLGFVYYSTGRFGEAAEEFAEAIQLVDGIGIYYGNLGDANRQLGRSEEAQAAYERAIELGLAHLGVNPADAEERAGLAMRFAGAGRCEEARREAARAAGDAPNNPTIDYYVAVAYAVCMDRSAAVRHTARAIERGIVADVLTNPDLEPLLTDPAIQKLLR